MASKLFYTPCAPVRYAHLVNADLYKGKLSYGCQLLLNTKLPAHAAFLTTLDDEFTALHGATKPRSQQGIPWKETLAENLSIRVVKFKIRRFDNTDGSVSQGPVIKDAKKGQWDGKKIGNGSTIVIAFTFWPYPGEPGEGCGVMLQPKAIQVRQFVPYIDNSGEEAADGFSYDENGYTVDGGFNDEFGGPQSAAQENW